MRGLIVLLLLLGAAKAEARGLGDRSHDRQGACEPGSLPPGAGISGCLPPLNADDKTRQRDPADQRSPAAPKPLWIPPLASPSPGPP